MIREIRDQACTDAEPLVSAGDLYTQHLQTWNNSETWTAAKHNAFLFEAVYAFFFFHFASISSTRILFFLNPKLLVEVRVLLIVRVKVLVVVLKEWWWGKGSC